MYKSHKCSCRYKFMYNSLSAVADIDSCLTHIIAVAATVNINSLNKNLIFYGSFLSSRLVLQSGLKEGYFPDLAYICSAIESA